jgi:DNA-binding beta-propeller fold protein YncE
MIALTKDEARGIISTGSFVTVTFTKRDGTVRVLNGRTGVVKGVKGVGMNYDPAKKDIVILYEANNEADEPSEKYRAVRLESIITFRANGKTYTIAR